MGHENYTRPVKAQGSSDRMFGIVFSIVFLLIAALPMLGAIKQVLSDRDLTTMADNLDKINLWSLVLSGVFLFVAVAIPKVLSPLNRLWTCFGLLVHRMVSPVILGIVFFLVLTPIALLMRLLRRDLLGLKYDRGLVSYWVTRQPPGPHPKTLSRQF